MRASPAHPPDTFKAAAQGIVSALGKARDCVELDMIFAGRIEGLGYQNAGYLRVFGEGQFHRAKYLFGKTAPGWAERYQSQHYSIDDPVVTAVCHRTGAFTLNEIAGPSRAGAPILADGRTHGLLDGLCAPIRAGYDEVGVVLLGAGHLLEPADYERFVLQGMCWAYAVPAWRFCPRAPIRRR